MTDYVKYVSNVKVEYPPVNKDGIINYNTNVEKLIEDGYKVFVSAERPSEEEIRCYHIEYTDNEESVDEVIIYDESQEEAKQRILEREKIKKTNENDIARDEALNQGVVYQNVLFDSDTDQKVNLLAIVSTMQDEETVIWFGKNNQPLECTKEDLINIGGLITQLHTFCWTKNAEIKGLIELAETEEEVQAIRVDYTLPQED